MKATDAKKGILKQHFTLEYNQCRTGTSHHQEVVALQLLESSHEVGGEQSRMVVQEHQVEYQATAGHLIMGQVWQAEQTPHKSGKSRMACTSNTRKRHAWPAWWRCTFQELIVRLGNSGIGKCYTGCRACQAILRRIFKPWVSRWSCTRCGSVWEQCVIHTCPANSSLFALHTGNSVSDAEF